MKGTGNEALCPYSEWNEKDARCGRELCLCIHSCLGVPPRSISTRI